jgi:threonine/homoserine/homoserine lactone efflux protein
MCLTRRVTLQLLISVAVFSFVTSVTPGPNNTFLLTSGANFGIRRSLPYINGIMAGLTVMMAAIGLGLGAVFVAFPAVYQVLKWVGFAYITYLAYAIIRSTSKATDGEVTYTGFVKSTIFQFVNPKAWIVVASFMATYAPIELGLWNVFGICALFLVTTYPGAFLWAVFGQVLSGFLGDPIKRRWFNIVAAILLVASMLPVLFLH